MLRIDDLLQSGMLVRASPAANIWLALKHSHALPSLRQRNRGGESSSSRTHHNHVAMFSCTHDVTRLRSVITAPCVRIVSLVGVETLMRFVKTSPEAFEILRSSL